MTDMQFPEAITGTPTMQQIIGTTSKVDDNHKVKYYFEMVTGDPVGTYYCTQAVDKNMLVRIKDGVYPVDSLSISSTHGLMVLLEARMN